MNILFVNPPNKPFTSHAIIIEPIDILNVATYTKSLGHNVNIIDMDAKQMDLKKLNNYLANKDFDIAVILYDYHIPLHTDLAQKNIIKISSLLKKHGSKIIIGGKTATYKKQLLLFPKTPVDILISHEMEISLKKLLELGDWDQNKLKTINGISFWSGKNIYSTTLCEEKFDLNISPIADRSLIDLSDYIDVRTILSSRGCSQRCNFCHVVGFWKMWKGKNPKAVVDEIEYLVRTCKAKKILFLDDNAIVDKKRMIGISNEIINRKISVALGCLGSISCFDDEMLKTMRRAGFCWIHYGIESGDDAVLLEVNKNTNVQRIIEVVKKTKDIGLRVRTSWIMDLPKTDITSLDKTINLILDLEPDEIRIHHLVIRLGSEYYKKYANGTEDWAQYIHSDSSMTNFSLIPQEIFAKKIKQLCKELKKRNYNFVFKPDDTDKSKGTKYVATCPLRYGLNWK